MYLPRAVQVEQSQDWNVPSALDPLGVDDSEVSSNDDGDVICVIDDAGFIVLDTTFKCCKVVLDVEACVMFV